MMGSEFIEQICNKKDATEKEKEKCVYCKQAKADENETDLEKRKTIDNKLIELVKPGGKGKTVDSVVEEVWS